MKSDRTQYYREALKILDSELSTRNYSKNSEIDGDDLHLTYQETFQPGQDRQEFLRSLIIVVPNQDEKLSLPITTPLFVSIVKRAISPKTGQPTGAEPIIESDELDIRVAQNDELENFSKKIRDNIYARLSNWLR